MDSEETPPTPDTPPTLAPLSLAAAAKMAGISVVTLRKHLQAGRLIADKSENGPHGETWQIDPAELAAFIGGRYGKAIDLSGLPPTGERSFAGPPANTETVAELHARLEETMLELGRYRALVEAAESADQRVENLLKEQIAELRDEVDRLRSRGFFARLRRP